ncbi:hypothetical protein KI387_015534 [Taxus chinensis]|uniref:F-box domain-containing protein n=1 Tax=Taxus chinensis TaxID=29808 RepID=A0AA38GG82_TAXCH|nr:hypothetical protein KI387_015534 [Taxus chinensis]
MGTEFADGLSPHACKEVLFNEKCIEKGNEFVTEANWSDLTEEALIDIFSRLDLEERWNSSFVCKSWFRASHNPFFWQVVDFEKYFARGRDTALLWTTEFQKRIDKMVKVAVDCSGENLRELHVRHCSDESLAYLAQRCPNVQRLSIKACQNVTDMSVCRIASGCPKIEELDISYCHNISCASLEKIGANCKYLTTIKRNMLNSLDPSEHRGVVPTEYVRMAPLSGDEEAAVFVKSVPNLKHLEMKFSKLSPKGLKALVDGCPNLEHLDLFGCSNLRSRELEYASANAKNLKVLIKPNFFIPRATIYEVRYGHWQLYDERFQTSAFQF